MKVSILSQGYAMVPLIMLQDKTLSQYSLRAYIAISSDWAKMGRSEVFMPDMRVVSGWPLKTCQRAILGLSRYAEITTTSGTKITSAEDLEKLNQVVLTPKSSLVKKIEKEKSEITNGDTSPFGVSLYYYYFMRGASRAENDNNILHSNILLYNKTPYIYDHKSNTEQEESKEELSTNPVNALTTTEKTLPVKYGNSWLKRVVTVYQKLYFSTYGRLPLGLNYARVGKSLKPLKENFTEYQLALMLIQYFQWYGVGGDDDFIHQKLQQNTFPLLWFPSYVDSISVSLGDVIDDEKQVERLVDEKLKEINE